MKHTNHSGKKAIKKFSGVKREGIQMKHYKRKKKLRVLYVAYLITIVKVI